MDEKALAEFIENESLDDEVLFLKPEVEIDENPEDSTIEQHHEDDMNSNENEESWEDVTYNDDEKLNEEHICWRTKSEFEPCCISVHPRFPEVAHVAIGNCGDSCTVYDFDSSNQDIENGELLVMGPFEETVSCCAFSSCGKYLALGCLDGNLLIYSKQSDYRSIHTGGDGSSSSNVEKDAYVKHKRIEKMLTSIEWLDFSEDTNLLVASGEGGLLVVYQLREDELQIVNINHNSNVGQIITYSSSGSVGGNMTEEEANSTKEKEYNIVCGCNESNVVIVTLNGYYKQTSISKISTNAATSGSKSVNIEEEKEEGAQENIISLSTHNRLKLCALGTTTGNVVFINVNKKSVARQYENMHSSSVESVIFTININNELAISTGLDGQIVFYDVLNNCNKINVVTVGYGLTKIVAHPLKSVFVASSVAGKILVLTPQKVLREVKCHTRPILDLQLLNVTGDYYAITVSEDRNIVM
ncbi:uncharacterized protein TOT_010000504 [Theileria orientalis strain Shintoku]|uniref:Anaphase-promoting complex subunit 4 WD40 domain-containing protein n=1 Tax=Theileria orientalis strain Shintoku TaxID=869250 RepID=J4C2P3_THEOR|nr:uncharacterized protein TOT_010000504 [Theileria orientalis strain Shintoku]BAM39041.1 uncharacterized protein TOT_010000504 [Theileria orientalis strain Shintoku]|eukprot:XP_009689342.1 uncharacterized protein TOT_010000504 [Theileria orientalis strain Shintoku]